MNESSEVTLEQIEAMLHLYHAACAIVVENTTRRPDGTTVCPLPVVLRLPQLVRLDRAVRAVHEVWDW